MQSVDSSGQVPVWAGVGSESAGLGKARLTTAGRRGAFSGLQRGETIAGYLFILPNVLGFLVFSLVPIISAFGLTLTNWSLTAAPQFVGIKNFAELVNDPLFWKTIWNSVYYAVGAVPIGVFLAFWLALVLNRRMRGVVFFRTLFYLPQVTLTVAIAVVWSWIYHPQAGLTNYLLSFFGIVGPGWLTSVTWAMPAVIIMANWHGIGGAMLIFLAGLQGIPEEYYEAAMIDGANWLQRIRYITVPLLSPTTFFVLVTSFIGALQAFDTFYIMTQGGPAFATTTIVYYIFLNAFTFFKMGYGATLAAILFLVILVITLIQWRLARTWVYGFEI